jgi:hypothetical protein
VSADASGVFVFEPSALGDYQLAMASAPGFFAYAPEWEQSPIALVARPELSVDGIVVYLTPAIDYQGRVVDAAGQPVAGATVTISSSSEAVMSAEESRVRSDDQGRFVFNARDFSIVHAVKGEERGSALVGPAVQISRKLVVTLGAGPDGSQVWRGAHGGEQEAPEGDASLRGRVVDSEGQAVPAFNVMLTEKAGIGNRILGQRAIFDGRGRFEFGGIPTGAYMVHIAAAGWAMKSADGVAAVGGGTELRVTLGKGASVFGRVTDSESGEPLGLAKVSMENSFGGGASAMPMLVSAVSDEEGNFELAGLKPGRRSVVASASQHHTKIVSALNVEEGTRVGPLEIALGPVKEGEVPRLDLAGIGVMLGQAEGAMLVRDLIAGGGAAEAGMKAEDLIVAIEGDAVSDLGWDDAIQRIRGPVGSQVHLQLRRGQGEFSLVVTRKAIRN